MLLNKIVVYDYILTLLVLVTNCTDLRLKVKVSLEQAMKAQRYSSTLSFTLALDGGGWSTPRPVRFTPGKRHGTHCIGGWVDPDRSGRLRKISPPPGFHPRAVQPVVSRYTDYYIPARGYTHESTVFL
jgi:hypothetical protein